MDVDEKHIEERRLRRQTWQIVAAFIAPALTVVGSFAVVWFTIRGELDAQTKAQRAQLLAETGEVICTGYNPFFADIPLSKSGTVRPAPSASASFKYDTEIQQLLGNGENLKSFCSRYVEHAPSLPIQRELIQQLADHPHEQAQILAMWRAIYKAQGWIDQIEKALKSSRPRP